MIPLLSKVYWDWNCFLSVLKIPHSMPFLFLRYLLRNLLLMGFPLYIIWFFSLLAFSILSFFSVLVVLMIICCGEVLIYSCVFSVLEASCKWIGISFLRFGKFSAIILLNILCIPLSMIFRFCLLMELVSSCVFLLQLLSLFSKYSSVFFFNMFCPQALKFSSTILVCRTGFKLYF
jgi:hypothetical protein